MGSPGCSSNAQKGRQIRREFWGLGSISSEHKLVLAAVWVRFSTAVDDCEGLSLRWKNRPPAKCGGFEPVSNVSTLWENPSKDCSIDRISSPPFSRIFPKGGSHCSQPWLWQPLTAVEAALLDLCDGQWAKFTPDWALLSQRAYPCDVFVFHNVRPTQPFWDRFFQLLPLLKYMFLKNISFWVHRVPFHVCFTGPMGTSRRVDVPLDLPFLTFLDVTLALTCPNVNKISKLWWKISSMGDVLVVVVSSRVLFVSIHASIKPASAMAFSTPLAKASATTVMSSRAHDEPRLMWKILQIELKMSRFRNTWNNMCLVQWHCTCGDDDKFGIRPDVFFPFSPRRVMSMSIEHDFYFHFDKNIGSNALPRGPISPDDPVQIASSVSKRAIAWDGVW